MVEEKVARTRRANERMVMDVDAAPDDVQVLHLLEPLPVVSLVQSVDMVID
jgi:hypothetical protein